MPSFLTLGTLLRDLLLILAHRKVRGLVLLAAHLTHQGQHLSLLLLFLEHVLQVRMPNPLVSFNLLLKIDKLPCFAAAPALELLPALRADLDLTPKLFDVGLCEPRLPSCLREAPH